MPRFLLCEACASKLKDLVLNTKDRPAVWWSTALADARTCQRLQQKQQELLNSIGDSDLGPHFLTERGIRPDFQAIFNNFLARAVFEEMGGTMTVIRPKVEKPKR